MLSGSIDPPQLIRRLSSHIPAPTRRTNSRIELVQIFRDNEVAGLRESIEALSVKVGWVLLVLGAMHFFNLFVFTRIRRRSRLGELAR